MFDVRRIVEGNLETGVIFNITYTNDLNYTLPQTIYEDKVDVVPPGLPHEKFYLKQSQNSNLYNCTLEQRTSIEFSLDATKKIFGDPFIVTMPKGIELFFVLKGVEFKVTNQTKLLFPTGIHYLQLNYLNPKNIPYYVSSMFIEVTE